MRLIHFRKGQCGVGLIEVLIAVLVLSIGFLGIAALQAKALSNNNSAMARTQATIASYSILDAMRADRANALAGDYDTTVTYSASSTSNDGNVTAASCSTSTSLSGLADAQVQAWCAGGGSGAPNGLAALGDGATGTIVCDSNGVCTITVTFDDGKATGGEATQAVVTEAGI
ncbi:type IV pilus modification protein PilV [Guyparkeria sp. SCN-R1]|uniref:type IV pilus modification protein PilV n=1 Tax=Guyparkeria sp. SCN-R1 TaxID=2341113 RepID=UPI001863F7D4|nr:type IV pilus modification protein PilV [Guyparkeria sp. SCN-R1]